MKLLLTLTFVALGCALVQGAPAKRDTKSDLIAKANELVTKAEAAITKLETDKKTQEATHLKAEEAKVKQLIADLTAATDEAKIKELEHQLQMEEHRLELEIAFATHAQPQEHQPQENQPNQPNQPNGPVSVPSKRDTKSDLIAKGNELVTKAEAAITKLETDKKTQEATHLKAEEAKVKQLIADLTAATDEAKIKELEHQLQMEEHRLEREIAFATHAQPQEHQPQENLPNQPNQPNQPNGPVAVPSKRDTKSDLIAKANELVTKAEAAITKLETDKKTQEATHLKAEEAKVKQLIADLTAATDEAKIKELEHQLVMEEHRLEREIAFATHAQPQEHQPQENLPNQPNQPNQPNGPVAVPSKRDVKSDLIAKANELVTKAEAAITKLEADKKTQEATHLKAEEAKVKQLIADLTAATDEAKIKELEHQLQMEEHRLEREIAFATHTQPQEHLPQENQPQPNQPNQPTGPVAVPSKRDTKSDLIAKANELVTKAEAAITKLETDKKTQEATHLKAEEAKVKQLIADLTAATDEAKIKELEHQLQMEEHRLEREIAFATHAQPQEHQPQENQPQPNQPNQPNGPVAVPSKRDVKSDLIAKANELVTKAEAAITKLETDKKTQEATHLKAEEAKVKQLIADLTAATDEAKIKQLEHQLLMKEHRLEMEIAFATHAQPQEHQPQENLPNGPVVPADI